MLKNKTMLECKAQHNITYKKVLLCKKILLEIVIIFVIVIQNRSFQVYANWYEEPLVIERTDFKNMWWLSKRKKAILREKEEEKIAKKREEYKNRDFKEKNIKWLYDDNNITRFPKNKWEVIDEDSDGIAYEYYFDNDGYLLIDTVTPDYEIVDDRGRKIDNNLCPIVYKISNSNEEETESNIKQVETSRAKIILGDGVVLREKVKVYDNSINRDALMYIDESRHFIKDTKAITIENVRWRKCSSIRCDDSYVILKNPNNNFNKISFILALEYSTDIKDESFRITVYDEDKYDELRRKNRLYEIEEIYENGSIGDNKQQKVTFTFNKSISRLRIEFGTLNERTSRKLLIKDMKYGFSKEAYRNEIIEKREMEEEVEELKRSGIYDKILYSLNFVDEDGNIIEDDEESDDDKDIENNDYDENAISYEDKVRDRVTGPAFDEELKKTTTDRDYGPAFISISTQSSLN